MGDTDNKNTRTMEDYCNRPQKEIEHHIRNYKKSEEIMEWGRIQKKGYRLDSFY